MRETPRRTAASLARGAMAFDGGPWLGGIGVPTLIVAGAEVKAVSPHHAVLLSSAIDGARLLEVAGAGHLLVCTHPDGLVQIVEDWLEQTDEAGVPDGPAQRVGGSHGHSVL